MSALSRPAPARRVPLLSRARPSAAALRALGRVCTTLAFAVAFLLIAGCAGLVLYGITHGDRIYEGVQVAGHPVGGLTRAEATALLEERFDAYATTPVPLMADGQSFVVTPGNVGADLDGAATADAAFNYGRGGSWWQRSRDWAQALLHRESVPLQVTISEPLFQQQLAQIAPSVVRPSSNAYVDMVGADAPALVDDVPGIAIDVTSTRARILDRFGEMRSDPVYLSTIIAPAAVSSADLEAGLPAARAAVGESLTLRTAEGSWVVDRHALRSVVSVSPSTGALSVDRGAVERLVRGIAGEIDRPAENAGIAIDDSGTLALVPGRQSATVDQRATTDQVIERLTRGEHAVEISVERADPAIVDQEAEAGIAEAGALIGDGVTVRWDESEATIGAGDLVRALTITPRPDEEDPFLFGFDSTVMLETISAIAAEIDDPAEDARFRLVNGQVTLVSKSSDGRLLDRQASLESILSAIFEGEDEATLTLRDDKADYTAKDIGGIAVPDVLADASTYYGDSSEPRRQNVERAVELEGGWLIPPGGVFSYVEFIGEVTAKNDFVTGFGIVADEERGGVTTAPVVGGGICQVSTTIFQAAFWAGMPILERYQHPYWIRTYGEAPRGMQGLDAMVNIEEDWSLDLKFENATDDWIAVEITADGERVTTRILGTDPGWDVKVDGPEVTKVIPEDKKTYYTDSPELPKGEELQVEYAQEGFDARVKREVRDERGEVIDEYVVESSYAPSQNTVLRGTGAMPNRG
ncbi:MAG TPA: peptidoglycan binding domain-containing protein [Thermomicrobiales bacterium]|nr:peptidoglycan binding domain-containing protein [Thermomicrobiales bacterium]